MAEGERSAGRVVLGLTARRAASTGVVWGVVFGVLLANEALGYRSAFPTVESRRVFAESFGTNGGLTAMTGPARHLDTLPGVLTWRMFFLMIVIGAIWGLLTATRALRGEEDAGRWELVLSGRTSRREATVEALLGLLVGWLALLAVTSAFLVVAGTRPSVGLDVVGLLFYAVAGCASALVFLALGALCSQLASTRRQANALGAAVLGVAWVLRMVADSDTSRGRLRWATPLGWIEELRPLTDPRPWALAPVLVLAGACVVLTLVLVGRRDTGAGVVAWRRQTRGRTRLLTGPLGLAVRLERGVAVGWILGLTSVALVFGWVAGAAASAGIDDGAVRATVAQLGGRGGGAAAWIGYELLYLAAILAFAAAGQVAAMRAEEADGVADNLLAGPVARARWIASRLLPATALVLLSGLGCGVGAWWGLLGEHELGWWTLLGAGLNTAVPALFVLGLGTFLFGVAPRLAGPALYAVVLWSFVVAVVGSSLVDADWILQTAVLSHVSPVPAAPADWSGIVWLLGLAAAGVAGGTAAFRRRDVLGG